MKKYIFAIIAYFINYIIIKGIVYCWDSIPIMPTDNQATLMTYFTFGLFVLELVVFIFSINMIQKLIK